MIDEKRVAVIVPIREGSQRIKNKNMNVFCQKPLAKWFLDKLRTLDYIDDIFVSTASREYTEIVRRWGYDVIPRPEELATDSATIPAVIQDVADTLNKDYGYKHNDYIIRTEITKPLTRPEQFYQVMEYASNNNMDSVFVNRKLKIFLEEDEAVNSQELPERFQRWGSIRLRTIKTAINMDIKTWGEGYRHKNLNIVNPYEIDINDYHDFIQAEALVEAGF